MDILSAIWKLRTRWRKGRRRRAESEASGESKRQRDLTGTLGPLTIIGADCGERHGRGTGSGLCSVAHNSSVGRGGEGGPASFSFTVSPPPDRDEVQPAGFRAGEQACSTLRCCASQSGVSLAFPSSRPMPIWRLGEVGNDHCRLAVGLSESECFLLFTEQKQQKHFMPADLQSRNKSRCL